ncbi:MAG: shikimate kinase [Candidatus Altiarchaeota archaeon]|nr:shikimate kinase [Candidatus Altiarchaeota archaeon]
MKAQAVCHGAATIVNAIATGRGAAFGISLETKASVELDDSGEYNAMITDHPDEDATLIKLTAKKVLDYLGLDYGAHINTESNIPAAAGLKSSSTAANATALATLGAVKKEHRTVLDDGTLIRLAVDAALDAGVTITGAFDDACASYFGGYVVTDNKHRKILKKGRMHEDLKVVIHVPDKKSYTADVDVKKTKLLSSEISVAWDEALKGGIYKAMNLNGLLYSAALGFDPKPAIAALEAGAVAAGLSGKGPAVVALTRNDPGSITEAWKEYGGKVIETGINNRKAGMVK